MLDIGWTEMAFIAVIALIVIGPKELPKAMRTVSKWVRKARSLAREFQSGLDDIARETELDEVKDQITGGVDFDLESEIENAIDPTGSVNEAMDLSSEFADLEDDPSLRETSAVPDPDYIPPGEEEATEETAPEEAANSGADSGPAGDDPPPESKEEASA